MSKLKVVILAAMIGWGGFESSQSATAAQFSAPIMVTMNQPQSVVTDARSLAFAKKCTIKRYRRR